MPDPTPPAGYKLLGSVNVPADAKLSPDIEDRRNWGPVRTAIGQQKQDFLDYWKDFHKTYPDFHTAYNVVRNLITGKTPASPPENIPLVASGFGMDTAPNSRIGEIKRFANGKIGRWDGHGWVLQ